MNASFPEPSGQTADPRELFETYLTYYRETVIAKAESLSAPELRVSRVDTGWTPLELANHLAFMERRWLVWGFLGEHVDDPWGDAVDGRWSVPDDVGLARVVARLREVGQRTSDVLAAHRLDEVAPPGPRFEGEPATLAWICFHVLQEYARHAGHLDIGVELAGGPTGE